MYFLQRFSIRIRLAAAFAAVLTLLGVAAGIGIWRVSALEKTVEALAGRETRKLQQAEQWLRGISVNLVRARTVLVVTDEDNLVESMKKDMDATSARITENEKSVIAMVETSEGKTILEKVSAARERYRTYRAKLIARRTAGEDVRADVESGMQPLANAYLGAVQEFVGWQTAQVDAARVSSVAAARSAQVQIAIAAALAFALGLLVAWLISRSILVPIARAREGALRIADGRLDHDIEVHGRDEAADMLSALAQMQRSLRRIVNDVHSSAELVTSASTQIAAGNGDLALRTEQQASSIEETAASIEELTATVRQNADSARNAAELSVAATEVATRGGEAVAQVVRTMEDIHGRSRRISEITGVIDAIAFQTNILALNAAVEAARAGDQGRGFAVVASEVRALAQRSAEAAREIKTLIGASVDTVANGSRLVRTAGDTMKDVVESVQRVSALLGEIAAATREQATGITQVSAVVTQLDRVTQQNAALVAQSAAASESLKHQAGLLVRSVSAFKLEGIAAPQFALLAAPGD